MSVGPNRGRVGSRLSERSDDIGGGAGGKGEVEPLWKTSAGSNVSSPVYYKGNLYWVSDKGIAHCLDAKTGKVVYQERLKNTGRVYASVQLAACSLRPGSGRALPPPARCRYKRSAIHASLAA